MMISGTVGIKTEPIKTVTTVVDRKCMVVALVKFV
jgi:hypothetical protein